MTLLRASSYPLLIFLLHANTTGAISGGVDPRIYINTFQMDDPEKTYVCRLDCKFDVEEEENNGFWAVTLKRTALNQFP